MQLPTHSTFPLAVLAPQAVGCAYKLITKRTPHEKHCIYAIHSRQCMKLHHSAGTLQEYRTKSCLAAKWSTCNSKIADKCAQGTQVDMQVLGGQASAHWYDSRQCCITDSYHICHMRQHPPVGTPRIQDSIKENRLDSPQTQQQPYQRRTRRKQSYCVTRSNCTRK